MSWGDDDPSPGANMIERELTQSVLRAEKAINNYVNLKQELAEQSVDTAEHPELRDALNKVDVATLSAFDSLKQYARTELYDIWLDEQVGTVEGKPVIFGSVHDAEESHPDVVYLDELRGKEISWTEREHVRFRGWQERHYSVAALMDSVQHYMRVKDLLFETLKSADFAPSPEMKEYEGEEVLTHDE